MTTPADQSVRTEAERIGQALLYLAARLPDGFQDLGGYGPQQAQVLVSYDAGDELWEIEFCALDPHRNFTKKAPDLLAIVESGLTRDRERAPDV